VSDYSALARIEPADTMPAVSAGIPSAPANGLVWAIGLVVVALLIAAIVWARLFGW